MFLFEGFSRRVALLIAVLGESDRFISALLFLQPGRLNSLIRFARALPHGGTLLFALAAVAALYNAVAWVLLWNQRKCSILPSAIFSSFVVFLLLRSKSRGVEIFRSTIATFFSSPPFLGVVAFQSCRGLNRTAPSRTCGSSILSHVMPGLCVRRLKATLPQ